VILQAPDAAGTIWFEPMCCGQAFKALFCILCGRESFWFLYSV